LEKELAPHEFNARTLTFRSLLFTKLTMNLWISSRPKEVTVIYSKKKKQKLNDYHSHFMRKESKEKNAILIGRKMSADSFFEFMSDIMLIFKIIIFSEDVEP